MREIPSISTLTVPSIVRTVTAENAAATSSEPPIPATAQAANIKGINDSQGPRMKIVNSTQGVRFLTCVP